MTSLRPIDISSGPRFEPAPQPVPLLDWVEIDRLRIDERYQRPLGKKNWTIINKIAAGFDWASFGPVLVAPVEGGFFAVIDGQHRVHAAALCGIAMVPAMVINISPAAQAAAFVQVNQMRTAVSANAAFRAALAAGEDWAVRGAAAVEAGGGRLMPFKASQGAKKPGQVYCVTVVRNLVNAGHAPALTAAVRALIGYDAKGTRAALFSEYILHPFVLALADDARFLALDLVAFLNRNDPFIVIESAMRVAAQDGDTRRKRILATNAFVRRLNHFADQQASPPAEA